MCDTAVITLHWGLVATSLGTKRKKLKVTVTLGQGWENKPEEKRKDCKSVTE